MVIGSDCQLVSLLIDGIMCYVLIDTRNYVFKAFVPYGLFGWRGEEGRVEGSRVELAKNKLILC